jgi:hypothetical protein
VGWKCQTSAENIYAVRNGVQMRIRYMRVLCYCHGWSCSWDETITEFLLDEGREYLEISVAWQHNVD